MAGHQQSLRITNAYRRHLVTLGGLAEKATREAWAAVDMADIDTSHPVYVHQAAAAATALQHTGVRLSAGYVGAFLRSELRRPASPPAIDLTAHAGRSRVAGKTLAQSLDTTAITMKVAIAEGANEQTASDRGLSVATRLAAAEVLFAARGALGDAIQQDDRIVGWERVTSGGCGACLAAATRTYGDDEPLEIHDNCQCSAEPIVANVEQAAPRESGYDIFDGMPPERQDELLGPDKAELIRAGDVPLHELLDRSPMKEIPDQITERPLSALT